jgi:hypothetical protein
MMHPSTDTIQAPELWTLGGATNFLTAVLILIAGWIISMLAAR